MSYVNEHVVQPVIRTTSAKLEGAKSVVRTTRRQVAKRVESVKQNLRDTRHEAFVYLNGKTDGAFKGFTDAATENIEGLKHLATNPTQLRDLSLALQNDPTGTLKTLLHSTFDPMIDAHRRGASGEALGRGLFELLGAVGPGLGGKLLGRAAHRIGALDNITDAASAMRHLDGVDNFAAPGSRITTHAGTAGGRFSAPQTVTLQNTRAAGSGRRLPMTHECVCEVANKYGIDISNLNIKINKARISPYGITGPDETITLNRAAFANEEQLARTLAHERYHVVKQLRRGMPYPATRAAAKPYEDAAEAFEDQWWTSHPLNN